MYHVIEGRFIAYFRVSTARQGRSGLGLESQKETVAGFLNGGRWKVMAEFVEIETGTLGDDERPQLARAIQACRIYGAKLLVSKLVKRNCSLRPPVHGVCDCEGTAVWQTRPR
jgi:DNA invertase Pin-like site-specific DNA recombinase